LRLGHGDLVGPPTSVGAANSDGAGLGVSTGPRVGVSAGADTTWRFWLTGDPTVSPYRAHKKSGLARLEQVRRRVGTPI
jgi:3-methyladenine DNA glycosylase Mpg